MSNLDNTQILKQVNTKLLTEVFINGNEKFKRITLATC